MSVDSDASTTADSMPSLESISPPPSPPQLREFEAGPGAQGLPPPAALPRFRLGPGLRQGEGWSPVFFALVRRLVEQALQDTPE